MTAPVDPHTAAPFTRRQVYRTIALAVIYDVPALPEPVDQHLAEDGRYLSLDFDSHAAAQRWSRWLSDCTERFQDHPPQGIRAVYYYGHRHGWSWHITGREPLEASPQLALAAAILTPDAGVAAS